MKMPLISSTLSYKHKMGLRLQKKYKCIENIIITYGKEINFKLHKFLHFWPVAQWSWVSNRPIWKWFQNYVRGGATNKEMEHSWSCLCFRCIWIYCSVFNNILLEFRMEAVNRCNVHIRLLTDITIRTCKAISTHTDVRVAIWKTSSSIHTGLTFTRNDWGKKPKQNIHSDTCAILKSELLHN